MLASEQYPRGLGPTLPQLNVDAPVQKTRFSAAEALEPALAATARRQVIVCGMETHICVAQTCADLISSGYDVVVPADAVLSRRKLDWHYGLEVMAGLGASISTAEALLFELLGKALQHLKFFLHFDTQ